MGGRCTGGVCEVQRQGKVGMCGLKGVPFWSQGEWYGLRNEPCGSGGIMSVVLHGITGLMRGNGGGNRKPRVPRNVRQK